MSKEIPLVCDADPHWSSGKAVAALRQLQDGIEMGAYDLEVDIWIRSSAPSGVILAIASWMLRARRAGELEALKDSVEEALENIVSDIQETLLTRGRIT